MRSSRGILAGLAMGWLVPVAGGGLFFWAARGSLKERQQERSVDMIISEAQRQIGLQYSTGADRDVKTLGLAAGSIAVAVAFPALGVAVQGWKWDWLAPLPLFLVAMACYVKSLWDEEFERGPDLKKFYATFSGTLLEAKTAFLSDLFGAMDHNESLLPAKIFWYRAGSWFLFAAGLATITVWIHSALGLTYWRFHG